MHFSCTIIRMLLFNKNWTNWLDAKNKLAVTWFLIFYTKKQSLLRFCPGNWVLRFFVEIAVHVLSFAYTHNRSRGNKQSILTWKILPSSKIGFIYYFSTILILIGFINFLQFKMCQNLNQFILSIFFYYFLNKIPANFY